MPTPEAIEDIPQDLDDALDPPVIEDMTGPTDTDASLDDDADLAAMAALLGEPQGQDGHDATEPGPDAPTAPDQARGQSGEPEWDKLGDDEKRRGYMREADYTRKTQDLARERRENEQLRTQLLQYQQDLLQQRNAPPPTQPAGPAVPPAPHMTRKDVLDPETGEVDLDKWDEYDRQRDEALEARIAEKYLTPLQQDVKAQQEAKQLEFVRDIETREAEIEKAFPHFRDEAVKQRVLARLQRLDSVTADDLLPAYFAEYPDQQVKAHLRLQAAKAKQKPGGQKPPTTPPNRQTPAREEARDMTDEELDEFAARQLSRLSGVPLRS